MTQPQTDLAYLHNEKAKAEQKLRSCQHRAGMLESFLVCPGDLTDDQVMELLKISFRQPRDELSRAF